MSTPFSSSAVAAAIASFLLPTGVVAESLRAPATTGAGPSPEVSGYARALPAPVGHRQPTLRDLPPAVRNSEGGAATNTQRDLDDRLRICRGC